MVKSFRGFSLLEVLVGMAVLSGLIIVLFQVFDFGATAFREANAKQDARGALSRTYTLLREELRRSHFRTVSVVKREVAVDEETYSRDAVCLGALRDWNSPESFDEFNGVPKWDRYIVFYGTLNGKLIRSTVDVDDAEFSPVPFYDLSTDLHLKDDPSQNSLYQTGFRVLSEELLNFRCELKPATDIVHVECSIMIKQNQKTGESQFELDVYPQNTWPKGDN